MITVKGKIRDLDPTPTEHGNHVMITTPAGHIRALIITGSSEEPDGHRYRAHRCPPPLPDGPPCDTCRRPMNPRQFSLRTNQLRHAGCEPEFTDQIETERRTQAARDARKRPAR